MVFDRAGYRNGRVKAVAPGPARAGLSYDERRRRRTDQRHPPAQSAPAATATARTAPHAATIARAGGVAVVEVEAGAVWGSGRWQGAVARAAEVGAVVVPVAARSCSKIAIRREGIHRERGGDQSRRQVVRAAAFLV